MRPDERATRTQRARSLALALGEAAGGFLSPHRATVEGLSPAERDAEPALAVGLTWDERCDLYDEMLEQERGARDAARAEAERLRAALRALEAEVSRLSMRLYLAEDAISGDELVQMAHQDACDRHDAARAALAPPEPSGDAA